MACSFSISFTGTPQDILSRAKAAIKSQGGNFDGDENSGAFGVTAFGNTIKGSYTITGQELNIVITDKPFFVPCNTIEGILKSNIGN